MSWPRRYAHGFFSFLLGLVGTVPSHRVRRFIYRRLFHLQAAKDVAFYGGIEVRSPRRIRIGRGTSIGHRVTLDGRGGLVIGECVNVSSEVLIWTSQHDYQDPAFTTRFKS